MIKYLIVPIFALATTACGAADAPKPATAAPTAASAPAPAATPETSKVCVDVKDKDGKPVKDAKGNVKQNCKEVKVHKKLEGTKVPEKK